MSLSREFASFVAGLRYEDLPPEVLDRAKGVTLQAFTSALIGRNMPASISGEIVKLILSAFILVYAALDLVQRYLPGAA